MVYLPKNLNTKLKVVLKTSTDTPNGGWVTNSNMTAAISTDDVYSGAEALKVTMTGSDGGYLFFTTILSFLMVIEIMEGM